MRSTRINMSLLERIFFPVISFGIQFEICLKNHKNRIKIKKSGAYFRAT